MDEIRPPTTHDEKRTASRDTGGFGAIDVAVLTDGLGLSEIPVLNVIGAVLLFPFAIVALVRLVWPLACWLASRLDYRRYLNGSTW